VEFDDILQTEIGQLRNILERSPLFSPESLFNDRFPKTCTTCNVIFEDRTAYLEKTTPASAGSLLFSEYGLQEYRNCVCGTTMTIWGQDDDRRDLTRDGILKRAIFMNCIDKLSSRGLGTEELLVKSLRKLFNEQQLKAS
jgi:hypothetical protein